MMNRMTQALLNVAVECSQAPCREFVPHQSKIALFCLLFGVYVESIPPGYTNNHQIINTTHNTSTLPLIFSPLGRITLTCNWYYTNKSQWHLLQGSCDIHEGFQWKPQFLEKVSGMENVSTQFTSQLCLLNVFLESWLVFKCE